MVQKMITATAKLRDEAEEAPRDRTWMAVAGGAVGALAAASCCVVPLALFALGISGAWIGNLTALAPYQPIFVALSAAALVYGFVRAYRSPMTLCDEGSYCARPASRRTLKLSLWLTTILVITAVAFPYVAARFMT